MWRAGGRAGRWCGGRWRVGAVQEAKNMSDYPCDGMQTITIFILWNYYVEALDQYWKYFNTPQKMKVG